MKDKFELLSIDKIIEPEQQQKQEEESQSKED